MYMKFSYITFFREKIYKKETLNGNIFNKNNFNFFLFFPKHLTDSFLIRKSQEINENFPSAVTSFEKKLLKIKL